MNISQLQIFKTVNRLALSVFPSIPAGGRLECLCGTYKLPVTSSRLPRK